MLNAMCLVLYILWITTLLGCASFFCWLAVRSILKYDGWKGWALFTLLAALGALSLWGFFVIV